VRFNCFIVSLHRYSTEMTLFHCLYLQISSWNSLTLLLVFLIRMSQTMLSHKFLLDHRHRMSKPKILSHHIQLSVVWQLKLTDICQRNVERVKSHFWIQSLHYQKLKNPFFLSIKNPKWFLRRTKMGSSDTLQNFFDLFRTFNGSQRSTQISRTFFEGSIERFFIEPSKKVWKI
jgi:hypothetical protein